MCQTVFETDKGVPISDLISSVMDQLGGDGLASLAGMLGTDEEGTKGAIGTAVGALTGALARNSAEPEGAAALDAALEKDHDGSIFDNISGFLGDIAGGPGAGILGHVFGKQEKPVAKEISNQSGLDMGKVMMLLAAVAPLVMGFLGKKKKEEELDADGVAGVLAGERQKVESSGMLGNLLGMLDGGGGGGMLSKIGGMLGGLFGRK